MHRPVRRAAKRWYGRLPKQRRVRGLIGFDHIRLLQVRNLVPGLRRFPIVITRTSDGLKFRITSDPLDEEIADSVTRKHRDVYFPDASTVTTVSTIVDIGAHHGHFAIAAAFEHPRAHVIAVEPSADAARNVRRHVTLNGLDGRVTVVAAALGIESGYAELLHDAAGSWGHSLVAVKQRGASERVRVVTFEEVLGGRTADFVKCNAEGGEVGLVEALESTRPLPATIVLMVHPEMIDVDRLRARVLRLGYSIDDAIDGAHPAWICSLRP